jgi:hypothetical protein
VTTKFSTRGIAELAWTMSETMIAEVDVGEVEGDGDVVEDVALIMTETVDLATIGVLIEVVAVAGEEV